VFNYESPICFRPSVMLGVAEMRARQAGRPPRRAAALRIPGSRCARTAQGPEALRGLSPVSALTALRASRIAGLFGAHRCGGRPALHA